MLCLALFLLQRIPNKFNNKMLKVNFFTLHYYLHCLESIWCISASSLSVFSELKSGCHFLLAGISWCLQWYLKSLVLLLHFDLNLFSYRPLQSHAIHFDLPIFFPFNTSLVSFTELFLYPFFLHVETSQSLVFDMLFDISLRTGPSLQAIVWWSLLIQWIPKTSCWSFWF